MSEISSKKIWVVGDRCQIITPKKYSGEKGYVSDFHTDDSPEIWVKLDNHDLQIRVFPKEIKFLEETAMLKANKSKPSDCWYTPPEIVDLIQQCLNGITLDPCADDGKHIEACQHFTVDDDGLSHEWSGRVFLNPPYSSPGVWIAKLQEEFNCGRVEEAIALVPASTDTKWFHPLISSNLICFWKGRIKFLDVEYQSKMPARQSHCLIYWGKNLSKFREVFSPYGSFNLLKDICSVDSSVHSIQESNDLQKFLEEKEVIALCNNLTSAQELVQDSASLDCNADLTSLEPQRLTNTAQASLNCDIPAYTTTETCEISQDLLNKDLDTICTPIESIYLQLPHPAPHFPQKANGLEVQTSVIVSPPSSKPLENYSQSLQPLKMSQDSSPAPITQDNPQAHISEVWSTPLTSSGTMRSGLLSEAAILPAPTLESEYCWLRSPGALSLSGKGRPPGQTKQEAELKKLGLLNSCEVLNPVILCQWYEIPETWLDPLESRAATELLEECGRQQEIFSILESQRSPCNESSTSTPCVDSQPPVTRANAKAGTYIIDEFESLGIIKDNLGFGFVVNWLGFGKVPNPPSGKAVTYNWERDDRLIGKLAIAPQSLIDRFLEENRDYECTQQSEALVLCPSCELQHIYLSGGCGMCGLAPANFLEEKMLSVNIERTQQLQIGVRVRITKTRTQNLSQWIGHEAEVTGINGETINVAAGEGREKKHLTLKKGWYEVIPENFLEETEPATTSTEKPKHRQSKGCLYKYLENKKLKNGTIASYPRVVGHRELSNPHHWRWGFNWEEKIDGEWKGRSIGSIPVGAIALIQSMQNEGVSLEEIIGFIRRAKSKKS